MFKKKDIFSNLIQFFFFQVIKKNKIKIYILGDILVDLKCLCSNNKSFATILVQNISNIKFRLGLLNMNFPKVVNTVKCHCNILSKILLKIFRIHYNSLILYLIYIFIY